MKIAGILLLVIGLGLTLLQCLLNSQKRKLLILVVLRLVKQETHHINIPLVFSIAKMGVGGILLLASKKRNDQEFLV